MRSPCPRTPPPVLQAPRAPHCHVQHVSNAHTRTLLGRAAVPQETRMPARLRAWVTSPASIGARAGRGQGTPSFRHTREALKDVGFGLRMLGSEHKQVALCLERPLHAVGGRNQVLAQGVTRLHHRHHFLAQHLVEFTQDGRGRIPRFLRVRAAQWPALWSGACRRASTTARARERASAIAGPATPSSPHSHHTRASATAAHGSALTRGQELVET
jgi:hypothetical protein